MDKKVVIIPTYNEKENIEAIIRKVFTLEGGYHILIIDDGSPDGTASIVKGLQAEFPEQLFMIERSGKLGLGTAYLTGFRWSLEHGYDYTFEMDADFSHNPDDLPRLYEACKECGGVAIYGAELHGGDTAFYDGLQPDAQHLPRGHHPLHDGGHELLRHPNR